MIDPIRGFSSAKFLPGSNDRIIMAVKSSENSRADKQASFVTIFRRKENGNEREKGERRTWEVLMPEIRVPIGFKFEGLEFGKRVKQP